MLQPTPLTRIVGEFRKTRHPQNVKSDKVLETCFQGQGIHDFRKPGTCEASDSQMCEVRESWFGEEMGSRTCGSPEPRAVDGTNFGGRPIREFVEDPDRESRAKTCTNRWRAKADSGICRGPSSGITRDDIHEPAEKQSQSCCPKKSEFRVWTSGRFVNMLDEKDILVCVHTRNILWGWGRFRHVKVPSSPYKMGRKGTCKRIQTFWNLCYLQRESQSLCALTLCLNVFCTLSLSC
jgi:hypothetical protein